MTTAAVSRAEAPPWWRGAVIYQIYPRSFADTRGDGVGDLPGITARLDHVASLGVDAIWISPFFSSPMRDYGYDVADYRDVDPMFGTLADFDALLARAHELGLRVLVDLVFSHTSHQHPWFAASQSSAADPKADWYVWADQRADGSPPNNWQSVFGGPAWTWNAGRRQYYMHNFLPEQPQLNGHHPAVQQALLDVMTFWLDRGVDGFRLDAINYAMHDRALSDNPPRAPTQGARTRPFDFQRHLHNQSQPEILPFLGRLRALTEARGKAFLVGEIGGEWARTEMKSYTADDQRLHSAYSFAFLSAPRLSADLVRSALAQWSGAPGEGWPSWAFSNHDAPRVVSRWQSAKGEPLPAGLAMALLLTLRGNAFVYQGEELGLPQATIPFDRLRDPEAIKNWPLTLGRDGARTPMPWSQAAPHAGFSTGEPWLPISAEHAALAVDVQERDRSSTLHLTRRLLALRRAHPALRYGALELLDSGGPLLAFDRMAGTQRVRCVFNLGDEAIDGGLLTGWQTLVAIGADPASTMIAPDSAVLAVPGE
ncbi:MAG: DUF3459 domain-containing protein [Sphingomonas sp.]|uniref:alpha-amylase family glycosyl hydrolase n=1 Tax=Sphingomonas sp. TaxID=28214 RepID=UPI0035A97F6F|nr:DUF3459 domain-containing protein [Sphingomonas sp.]